MAQYTYTSDEVCWIVHPLTLLLDNGNGRGSGDYRGVNEKQVGT